MIELKQGDCLELMKSIDDKSIDLILCDLPYGVTACKWDSIIPFEPLWNQYNRIIKDNGAIVLFTSGQFTPRVMASNIDIYISINLFGKKQNQQILYMQRIDL